MAHTGSSASLPAATAAISSFKEPWPRAKITSTPAVAMRSACSVSSSCRRSAAMGAIISLPSTPATTTGRAASTVTSNARSTASPVSSALRCCMPTSASARGVVSAVRAHSTLTSLSTSAA